MSRVTRPALRGSLLGAVLRLWNPVMRTLLGSPLHWPLSRWFAVLAWSGRKTGRRHSTPVSYVREGATAYITTGDRWWRNLTGGAPVTMRVAGRWHEGIATPVTDPLESRTEHERLFREHRWFRRLSGIPSDRRGDPDPAAIDRALAAGRVIVRVDLPGWRTQPDTGELHDRPRSKESRPSLLQSEPIGPFDKDWNPVDTG